MRYAGPKTRLARRIGEALRDKDAKILLKRNYPPGMHGDSRSRKSEYGIQLSAKQKAKWIYGVVERQFRKYVQTASANKGMTDDILLKLLESRLDNVVYRLGFATSRAQARQLVGHGFFLVNGKKVKTPSLSLRVGDEVSINPIKRDSKYVERLVPALKEVKPQDWLKLDAKELSGRMLSDPTYDLTGSTIEPDLIIENYSR